MPVTYRYTLQFENSSLQFGTENVINWQDIRPSITRHEKLRGAVLEMTNTFQFVGDARLFLMDAEDKAGIDADVYLTIEIGNESGHASSFKQLGSVLKANFAKTFLNTTDTLSISFSPSNFQEVVLNRWETSVSHNQLTSIDGDAITGDANQTKRVSLHVRELDQTTKFEYIEPELGYGGIAKTIPLNIKLKGDEYAQTVPEVDLTQSPPYPFYANTGASVLMSLKLSIKNISVSRNIPWDIINDGYDLTTKIILVLSKDDVVNKITLYEKENTYYYGTETRVLNGFELETEIVINDNEAAFLIFEAEPATGPNQNYIEFRVNSYDLSFEISPKLIDYPTEVNLMLVHEAIERNLQIITGQQNCLYAPIFGRTELGYPEDGEYAYTAIGSGYMLRNFPFDEKVYSGTTLMDKPLTSSLKDLLENGLMRCYNLVCSFKIIDNEIRFVIEPYSEAYPIYLPDNELVELGIIETVDRELNEKMHYSQILCGYKNQEYEEINGVLPYNSQFEYAAPLKSVNNKLEITSEVRADDYGIEYKRRKQFKNFPTTDTKGDTDLFFIRCIAGDEPLFCERNESFETVTGIYAPDSAYNLNLSPARNLQRWWSDLNGGLIKKQGSSIKYMRAEKNSTLATKKTGEDFLTEAGDLLISRLNMPILLPYTITLNAIMTVEKWNQILSYPNRPIKFDVLTKGKKVSLYGIIESAEFNVNEGIVENLKLTQVNR